jgi:hypothetical protein
MWKPESALGGGGEGWLHLKTIKNVYLYYAVHVLCIALNVECNLSRLMAMLFMVVSNHIKRVKLFSGMRVICHG